VKGRVRIYRWQGKGITIKEGVEEIYPHLALARWTRVGTIITVYESDEEGLTPIERR